MKIACISCVFPPYLGGIANVAYQHARIFHDFGHEVTVFTLDTNKKNTHEQYPFVVHRLSPLIMYGNAGIPFSLLTTLSSFDLIWFHYPFIGAGELVYLCSLLYGTRLIMYYHMDPVIQGILGCIINTWERGIFSLLEKISEIICVSSRDYVQDHHNLRSLSSRYVEVPLSVDTKQFIPGNPHTSILTLLFVGSLDSAHYFKGVDVLLDAYARVIQQGVTCHLRIVGSGDLKSSYEKHAHTLGISHSVVFVGSVSHESLIQEYQRADVVVMPSLNKAEAFGMVAIEAFACGVPVIASDLPGVRTVVTDDVGIRVPAGDVDALTRALLQLCTHQELRTRMGQNARNKAEHIYDLQQHARTLERSVG